MSATRCVCPAQAGRLGWPTSTHGRLRRSPRSRDAAGIPGPLLEAGAGWFGPCSHRPRHGSRPPHLLRGAQGLGLVGRCNLRLQEAGVGAGGRDGRRRPRAWRPGLAHSNGAASPLPLAGASNHAAMGIGQLCQKCVRQGGGAPALPFFDALPLPFVIVDPRQSGNRLAEPCTPRRACRRCLPPAQVLPAFLSSCSLACSVLLSALALHCCHTVKAVVICATNNCIACHVSSPRCPTLLQHAVLHKLCACTSSTHA